MMHMLMWWRMHQQALLRWMKTPYSRLPQESNPVGKQQVEVMTALPLAHQAHLLAVSREDAKASTSL